MHHYERNLSDLNIIVNFLGKICFSNCPPIPTVATTTLSFHLKTIPLPIPYLVPVLLYNGKNPTVFVLLPLPAII